MQGSPVLGRGRLSGVVPLHLRESPWLVIFPHPRIMVSVRACRLSWWLSKVTCQRRRLRFNPWVRKIPWRRKWQSTPGFLPGQSHRQRLLAGHSTWGPEELDTFEQLSTAKNNSSKKKNPVQTSRREMLCPRGRDSFQKQDESKADVQRTLRRCPKPGLP